MRPTHPLIAMTLLGCSASTTTPRSDVPAVSDASDVPSVSDVPDVSAGPCPASVPQPGPCAREGLVCQYGSDPREACRPSSTCRAGRWEVNLPPCAPITDPAMCPASREGAANAACDTMGAVCNYGGLACTCTNCVSFPIERCLGPLRWRCAAPNMQANCPAVQPNLGQPCSPDQHRCEYDCEQTGANGGRLCMNGVWTATFNQCPISSRAAKRDIRYLSESESETLAREALQTRLATYEYTDPALSGRRRLGFIYEDRSTHQFARDPAISGVDLYGYTSIILATVQRQQRQIEALQREVRALRSASNSPR